MSSSFPDYDDYSVMKATLTDDRFDDPDWIYERKLDGVRALVFWDGEDAALVSRNGERMYSSYPEIVEALEERDNPPFVADGEIVTFEGDVTSFSKLQARMNLSDPEEARATGVDVYLYLFDILWLDGEERTEAALQNRKSTLRDRLEWEDPVRYVDHRREEGTDYWEEACDKGWEGVIAKDTTSKYVQSRSRKWLKFKCVNRQELVIGGFTEPSGERIGFGALLVGFYDGDDLCYAGKVGTGYDDEFLESFRERLDELERDDPAFANPPDEDYHWVEPELVGEVGFTEWTDHDKLRHPRFLGLRTDKDPKEVVKEEPQ